MLRTAKKKYHDEKFNDESSSASDIWKTAYSLLGSVRSGFPSQLIIAGKLVTKPILLATEMNKYFIKKISDLKSANNHGQQADASDILRTYMSNKRTPPDGFSLQEIDTEEMKRIIKAMRGKKSCGLD